MEGIPRSLDELSPEERMDALAEILAEGIISLSEDGQLESLLIEPLPRFRRFGKPLASAPETPYRSP